MSWSPDPSRPRTYTRPLGPSELAFHPAWAKDAIGDMFLHLAFCCRAQVAQARRVRAAWGILRVRHPVLGSRMEGEGEAVRFVYTPPTDVKEALAQADASLNFCLSTKHDLIDAHMNSSTRVLSPTHLSQLTISSPPTVSQPSEQDADLETDYDLLIAAPHFTGDGTSLHALANDLMVLLASSSTAEDLEKILATELEAAQSQWTAILPSSIESRLPSASSLFQRAALQIAFQLFQSRHIGGHTLPRQSRGTRKTVIEEVSFDEERTEKMLKRCKERGVSVSHALFALCAVAWARMTEEKSRDLPIMMYTALNLRPYLSPSPLASYCYLALGYFNVSLPSFPALSPSSFWARAASAKAQTARTTNSPLLIPRCLIMAEERCASSLSLPPPFPPPPPRNVPDRALFGLSLIGNLDRVYNHSSYPAIKLRTVTTASRQRPGGLLVLEHTFKGKLWLHMAWDANGFGEGVVEGFWEGLQKAVVEFLEE